MSWYPGKIIDKIVSKRGERLLERRSEGTVQLCAIGYDSTGNLWIYDGKEYTWKNLGTGWRIRYTGILINILDYNWHNRGEELLVHFVCGSATTMPFSGTVITFGGLKTADIDEKSKILLVYTG